jgi:hypothetical protein
LIHVQTSTGSLCHVDKDGNALGKVGKEEEESQPIAIKRKKIKRNRMNKRRRDKTVTMMNNHAKKRNSRGKIL